MANNNCEHCKTAIARNKPGVSCSGFCGASYHIGCVGVSSDILKHLKTPGLYWFCEGCDKIKSDYGKFIEDTLEHKICNMLKNVEEMFTKVKDEVINVANKKLNEINIPKSLEAKPILYSKVVSKTPMIVVKPKDNNQKNEKTKADIVRSIDPVEANIPVSTVKNLSNGGILIGCNNNEGTGKFHELARHKLAKNYDIKMVSDPNPKVKIVGLSEKYSDKHLLNFLKNQNPFIAKSTVCKVLKIWSTKKNSAIFQAVLEIDVESYCQLMNTGKVLINYDSCVIYDAIELTMCFKCCGLGHVSKYCKSDFNACPKCSLSHMVSECICTEFTCVNCKKANIPDFNHAAWDSLNCPIYKNKLEQYKSSMFGIK